MNKEQQITEDNELDLHLMAIKSHNRNFLTFKYPYLHMTPENERTYELGFLAGIMYATGEMNKLHEKQELERQASPTLNRQKETNY
ncbi:MAG: hypothetical protein V4538_15350 [Bacteroidota bacterium]